MHRGRRMGAFYPSAVRSDGRELTARASVGRGSRVRVFGVFFFPLGDGSPLVATRREKETSKREKERVI